MNSRAGVGHSAARLPGIEPSGKLHPNPRLTKANGNEELEKYESSKTMPV
jgi:hypothetical protein